MDMETVYAVSAGIAIYAGFNTLLASLLYCQCHKNCESCGRIRKNEYKSFNVVNSLFRRGK